MLIAFAAVLVSAALYFYLSNMIRLKASTDTAAIAKAALRVMRQKINILEQIDNDIYTKRIEKIYNATIGAHIRHSVNHFETLIQAHDYYSQKKGDDRVFNYDHRSRDTMIEVDRQLALHSLHQIMALVPELSMEMPVHIGFIAQLERDESGMKTDRNGNLAYDFKDFSIESTVARELAFVTHHSVHHLASIRLMLNDLNCNILDSSIGIAPSTLKFEQKETRKQGHLTQASLLKSPSPKVD